MNDRSESYYRVQKERIMASINVKDGSLLEAALSAYAVRARMDAALVGLWVKAVHGTYDEIVNVFRVTESHYRGSVSSAARNYTAESGWSVFVTESDHERLIASRSND